MNVDVQAMARRLQESLGKVIVGKEAEIELCIVGLLCRGHLLIEDVPGTGKTLLAKALARSSGCSFERVQFTPDLLPGDVTGVSVYNPQAQTFEFRKGPIFAQVLLADEINRATPKTQSALLEAMEEWQVTVDGTSHPLPDPFMVLATQNPIELGGTFPLPEAQVDRFLLKLRLGYLPADEEAAMLDRFQSGSPLGSLEPVTDADGDQGRPGGLPRHLLRRISQGVLRAHRPAHPRASRRLARIVATRHARVAPCGTGSGGARRP